jgi:hypothetical protein
MLAQNQVLFLSFHFTLSTPYFPEIHVLVSQLSSFHEVLYTLIVPSCVLFKVQIHPIYSSGLYRVKKYVHTYHF